MAFAYTVAKSDVTYGNQFLKIGFNIHSWESDQF